MVYFLPLMIRQRGRVRLRQMMAPITITMLEVTSICPNATIGLEMAPATKPEAPKMALAAPAFWRSASSDVAVSPGCISPKLMSR